MGVFADWPPEAVVALATLLISNLILVVREVFRWRAAADGTAAEMHKLGWEQVRLRDSSIELLRRLLYRGRARESAWATGCELLMIALPDRLTSDQRELAGRAKGLFEGALLHGSSEDGGP